jgi:hypothetical protein
MTKSRLIGGALLAAACLAPASLVAQEMPFHQRVGLWLIDTTMHGRTLSSKQCVSAESQAYEKKLSESVRQRNHCTALQITHGPDGSWSANYTCTFADGKRTTAHSTFRGDPDSKFTATFDTGKSGPNSSVFTYAGSCPAGMHGGDIAINGRVMNMMNVRH